MASLLQVRASRQGNITIVALIGQASIDVERAEFDMDRIIAQRPEAVLVDVTELSFLASIGMRLLVNLRRNVVSHGGWVKLAGLQPLVESALRTATLLDLFQVYPTLQAALDASAVPPNPA
jgi:anti-anti-sigma factor